MKNLLIYIAVGVVTVGTVVAINVHNIIPSSTLTSNSISSLTQSVNPQSSLIGSYRCWSYNVSGGGGGNCRLFTPIVLKSDGTYSVSSEHGTYKVSGNIITLSQSKIRGPGKIIDGNKIRFEYDYKGWHQVITYLRDKATITKPNTTLNPSSPVSNPIAVTLSIVYPAGTSGLSGINSVDLKSHNTKDTTKYEALPYLSDSHTLRAIFGIKKGVLTGNSYDVYLSSGFSEQKVGSIDLTSATGDQISKTISATVNKQ